MKIKYALALVVSVAASAAMAQSGERYPQNDVTTAQSARPENMQASIRALQSTLTELQSLQLQTKQAHWNVSGTLFYPLHELLQEHYEGIAKYADECAERLLAIGASSDGRAATIVRTSVIPEYPGGFTDDAQVIRWFSDVYLRASKVTRAGIDATEKTDPTSSNLLQEIDHGLAKYQWQMRAHIQETATDPNTGADIGMNRTRPVPAGPAPR